jgi:DNA-binding response OmpR family regulator
MLPDGTGFQLIQKIKDLNKDPGILIISARNELQDRLHGLALGADDYLAKPFYLAELEARLHAISRRKHPDTQKRMLLGPLSIDLVNCDVIGASQGFSLTKKEWRLLLFFINNKNKFITKEAIAEHLWETDMYITDNYNFIYTHVKNIRRKLVLEGCPDFIKVIYGVGYKFELPHS